MIVLDTLLRYQPRELELDDVLGLPSVELRRIEARCELFVDVACDIALADGVENVRLYEAIHSIGRLANRIERVLRLRGEW